MNARSQVFDIGLEPRQVEEAVLALFHTVLFHRTTGKFSYKDTSSYHINALGYEDVDCDYIDHTYLRAHSASLAHALSAEVGNFGSELRAGRGATGQVSLEFYQKRRKWPFNVENIPWEVWTVKTDLVTFANEQERQRYQESLGDTLSDKVIYIAEVMNRDEYVPKMPSKAELDLVFDTSFPDVQPFLFKVCYSTAPPSSPSVGSTVRRLLKDTLAL